MNESVWVPVLVAVIVAVVAPALLSVLTSRQRRAERVEDYARQDAVAAKTAEAARLLLAANERVAAQSAEADRATQAKLDQIHSLVDGNLTEAQEREVNAMRVMLASMREVVALSRKLGLVPAPDSLRQIESTEARIGVLEGNLARKIAQVEGVAEAA
jgi:hypothetical protein